jgi:hypothetical protein
VRLHYGNCNSGLCLSQFPCVVCEFAVLDSISTYHFGLELLKVMSGCDYEGYWVKPLGQDTSTRRGFCMYLQEYLGNQTHISLS